MAVMKVLKFRLQRFYQVRGNDGWRPELVGVLFMYPNGDISVATDRHYVVFSGTSSIQGRTLREYLERLEKYKSEDLSCIEIQLEVEDCVTTYSGTGRLISWTTDAKKSAADFEGPKPDRTVYFKLPFFGLF